MSNLGIIAAQIADRVAPLIKGPCTGSILAQSLSGTVIILPGTRATLPDGRVLRVTRSTKVGTSPIPVPARLLYLSPSVPVPNNFSAIPTGALATWQAPPANTAPTASILAFAPNAEGLVGSYVEWENLKTEADLYAAGENGSATLILQSPDVTFEHNHGPVWNRNQHALATWKLRLNVNIWSPQKERRTSIRHVYDALQQALMGARIGSSVARFAEFKQVKSTAPQTTAFELHLQTMLVAERVESTLPDFADLEATVTVPGPDAPQPDPFSVVIVATP